MMLAPEEDVPVYRALLPVAERIAPYLAELDRTRLYSNFGPLAQRFETRVAALAQLSPSHVVSSASGTSALVGAILGRTGRASTSKPVCICPAYTFVATASAIQQCGYTVMLADIAQADWILDPDALCRWPLDHVGLVVVVAPYGRPPSQKRWAEFEQRTGVPVVIDGAAAFEAVINRAAPDVVGSAPLVLSFHATKTFSTGEGGAILCTDEREILKAKQALNFGFCGERVSQTSSINGKMSEYHAAVGLAELDGWPQKQDAFRHVVEMYGQAAQARDLLDQLILPPEVASCYTLFLAENARQSSAVTAALRSSGLEYRFWYGAGLHKEPAFRDVTRLELDRTDHLAPRLIGLPTAPDLPEATVERIMDSISEAL